jgi:hypothetical protein
METAAFTNDVHGEISSSSDKLGTDAAAAGLFGSEESSLSSQYTSGLEPTSQEPYAFAHSQNPSSSASYNDDQQAQGRYDEHGQWHPHQYLPTQPAKTGKRFANRFSTWI